MKTWVLMDAPPARRGSRAPSFGRGPRSTRSRKLLQTRDRIVPADTGIRNTAAVRKLLTCTDRLIAFDKIAFKHDSENTGLATVDLRTDILTNRKLLAIIFTTVGMTHIDHNLGCKSRLIE